MNKPAGLAVHGGSGVSSGLIEVLRFVRKDCHFLELAHRLDRETSGCLIIAKKMSVLRELHELLREGKIQKIYFALTMGHWPKAKNFVAVSLKKNQLSSGERRVKVDDEGKASATEFHVEQSFSAYDLVQAILHTGRTHQIRVHAQYSGHPIAGDTKYGDKAFNQVMKQKGLKRLFLHAEKIAFTLPSTGKYYSLSVPLDDELQRVLREQKE